MLFLRYCLSLLPVALLASASPVLKRATAHELVTNLQTEVAGPVADLKAANAAGTLQQDQAIAYLTRISDAITTANAGLSGITAKRSIDERQEEDLQIIGRVLAEIITDVVEAIEDIGDDLQGLPLIGAIIISIDGGLKTLLLGLQIVLVGVVQILRGLLLGVSGLLFSLGNGLLAGLLFGA